MRISWAGERGECYLTALPEGDTEPPHMLPTLQISGKASSSDVTISCFFKGCDFKPIWPRCGQVGFPVAINSLPHTPCDVLAWKILWCTICYSQLLSSHHTSVGTPSGVGLSLANLAVIITILSFILVCCINKTLWQLVVGGWNTLELEITLSEKLPSCKWVFQYKL